VAVVMVVAVVTAVMGVVMVVVVVVVVVMVVMVVVGVVIYERQRRSQLRMFIRYTTIYLQSFDRNVSSSGNT